jgi:drug/metabolite transporter (DMT)-like permease
LTSRQLVAFSTLAFLWGSSFLFIKVLVNAGVSPLGIAALRTSLGALVLLPFAWPARRHFPRGRRDIAIVALLGLLNFAAPWTLFGVGQEFAPSAVGAIVNASNPVWAAVIAVPFLAGETLTRLRALGLAAGFIGVAILAGGRIDGLDNETLFGVPPMVLATICYAVSAVIIRAAIPGLRALPLTISQLAVATAVLVPLALVTRGYDGASFGWNEWASLFLLGCVGSGLGVLIYMWLISEVGPVRSAVVTYLMTPIGVLLGWWLLDEEVTWTLAAGLVLILSGVALVQFERVLASARRQQRAPA